MSEQHKSTAAYAPDKALSHRDRLLGLKEPRKIVYPAHLHLILSDLCNLNCPGCAYRMENYSSNQLFGVKSEDGMVNNNPNRMIEYELAKKILLDCKEMGTLGVEFTGGGEPTLHPQIRELMDLAQSLGLHTALITNGLRMGQLTMQALGCDWVRFSIDAATPETYAKVRPSLGKDPRGGRIDDVLTAMHDLSVCAAQARSGVTIGAGFVVQKENYREIIDAVEMYRDFGAHNVRISGLFTPEKDGYFDGWRKEAEELEARAIRDFDQPNIPGGFRVYGRFSQKVADLQAPPDYDDCHYQRLTTYIGGDANLYRCCVTAYNQIGKLGSVRDAGGFKALWDSTELQAKLRVFSARACGMCQFNDRNHAIDDALKRDELPEPRSGVIHPWFV